MPYHGMIVPGLAIAFTMALTYPKAGTCPLTLRLSKGVSGLLYGDPLIWFDKHVLSVAEVLTMSGVDPDLEQLQDHAL